MASTPPDLGPAALFRAEYDRINARAYGGRLPPFPGVRLVDRDDVFSMTCTLGAGPWRRLQPFLLSVHVQGPLLLEAIRHEVAHAAALLFHDDESHGPTWRMHARLAGASGEATLDSGHPLRATWVAP